MRIAERDLNGAVVVDLVGEIRGQAANAVVPAVTRLVDAGCRVIVVNLGGVPAMDAAGLGALAEASAVTRASGGVLCLAGVTDRIDDLVVLTRLLTAFDTFDTVRQALQHAGAEYAGAAPVRAATGERLAAMASYATKG